MPEFLAYVVILASRILLSARNNIIQLTPLIQVKRNLQTNGYWSKDKGERQLFDTLVSVLEAQKQAYDEGDYDDDVDELEEVWRAVASSISGSPIKAFGKHGQTILFAPPTMSPSRLCGV